MFDVTTSKDAWMWAYVHPYLFTLIRVGTPSVYAIILYVASRIITKALKGRR